MIKRALVISGGSARGSYSVGVLKALTDAGRSWNSVHGISVGALNGAWIAMHAPDENYNIKGLYEIWRAIEKTEDIVKPWCNIRFFNYLMSIWKGSLNSRKNLQNVIEKHIDAGKIQSKGTKFTVGVVSLNTGKYKIIHGSNSHIKDFVLASSLLPVVYEPMLLAGEKWVDGGIRHQIPIIEALMERPDEIDVILNRNPVIDYDVKPVNDLSLLRSAPRIALRTSEIMNDQVYEADFNAVLRAIRTLTNVKINLYLPRSKSVIEDSMIFDYRTIEKTISQGYEETKTALEAETQKASGCLSNLSNTPNDGGLHQ